MPTGGRGGLTDAMCRAAAPGPRARKLFDAHGLYLAVLPSGVRSWRVAYRLAGKPQTATLGPYPLLSLAEARRRRDALRLQLLAGADPRAARRVVPARAAVTLSAAVDSYWRGRHDVSESYRGCALRAIEMHVQPTLGRVPVGEITRDDLMVVLRRMDAAGLHVYVRRVRMWLGQVWEWAIEHGHAQTNPAAAIRPERAFGRRPVVHFAALPLSEVGALLRRLRLEQRSQAVLACELLALTWVRTGELRAMRWDQIDGAVWRVPAAAMKMRREHLVPLSTQAQALLADLRERAAGPLVLPALPRQDRAISENAVLSVLQRCGYAGRMTGHGWRSCGSTWANEAGYSPDAIERQLAHTPADDTRAAYNRAAYWPERQRMLQAWADWLAEVERAELARSG